MSQDWEALKWASDDLKGDRDIVSKALSQHWEALKWASDDLEGDREIVLKAVSQDWEALKWASSDLCEDQEIWEIITQQQDFNDMGMLLKVSLLSGRWCTFLWSKEWSMARLLVCSGENLGLDWQKGVATGKLVPLVDSDGTGILTSLDELQPGKMHFLTLVLS